MNAFAKRLGNDCISPFQRTPTRPSSYLEARFWCYNQSIQWGSLVDTARETVAHGAFGENKLKGWDDRGNIIPLKIVAREGLKSTVQIHWKLEGPSTTLQAGHISISASQMWVVRTFLKAIFLNLLIGYGSGASLKCAMIFKRLGISSVLM